MPEAGKDWNFGLRKTILLAYVASASSVCHFFFLNHSGTATQRVMEKESHSFF
jgi:hydrogenase maturation factor